MPLLPTAIIRLLLLLVCAGLVVACGTPKISRPSGQEEQQPRFSFPKNPPVRDTRTRQNVPKDTDLLDVIARINRASESAAKGDFVPAGQLADISMEQINRLPVAQQADWYRLRSLVAQDSGDLQALLRSEQQLLVSIPTHSRTQHNTGLFSRLLAFGEREVTLAQSSLKENRFATGWLALVEAMTSLPAGYSQQKLSWQGWQRSYSGHSAERFPPEQITAFLEAPTSAPGFALMLPRSGSFAPFGDALAEGFYQVARHPSNSGWQVEEFDITNATELSQALAEITATGINKVVGPLDKILAQRVWNDTRVENHLALNFIDGNALSLPRGQLGLAIEDEAEFVARLLNGSTNLRVALLQQSGSNPERAVSRLRQKASQMPQVYRFSDNRSLIQQLEQALGIGSHDIKAIKDSIASYHEELKKTSDPAARAALHEQNPAKELHAKLRIDMLLIFADAQYAAQIMPLLAFYYADSVKVLGYSAAYDLARLDAIKDWEGMYLVDIPTISKKPREWHEWVQNDFTLNQQFYRFYALGVDAALVAYNLERLSASPGMKIRGATGRLGWDPQSKRITRDLQLYRVHNGEVVKAHPRSLFDIPCAPDESSATGSCL